MNWHKQWKTIKPPSSKLISTSLTPWSVLSVNPPNIHPTYISCYPVAHNRSLNRNLKIRLYMNNHSQFPRPYIGGAGLIHYCIHRQIPFRRRVPVPLSFATSAHWPLENRCNTRKNGTRLNVKLWQLIYDSILFKGCCTCKDRLHLNKCGLCVCVFALNDIYMYIIMETLYTEVMFNELMTTNKCTVSINFITHSIYVLV